jgi:hypothetical protein
MKLATPHDRSPMVHVNISKGVARSLHAFVIVRSMANRLPSGRPDSSHLRSKRVLSLDCGSVRSNRGERQDPDLQAFGIHHAHHLTAVHEQE